MNAFYHGTFVQDLRKKAARLVAAKCTLAARIDSFHENSVETSGKSEFFVFKHCKLSYISLCIVNVVPLCSSIRRYAHLKKYF